VRGKFVNAPSLYERPGAPTSSKKFNTSNVFRCPEGVPEDYLNNITNGQGLYPTHMLNNGYFYINDAQAAQDGLGIASWYQLNSRGAFNSSASQATTAVAGAPGPGRFQLPFMSYVTTSTFAHLTDPAFTRHMGQVKKASELIMLIEAASNNWYFRYASYPHWGRLGARHGKKTGDGMNAWTNFAFFDGHVAQYPTVDFMGDTDTPTSPSGYYQGTIFFLNNQKPR
jgi:prepilin-type processing-associated H-X9-DG protein